MPSTEAEGYDPGYVREQLAVSISSSHGLGAKARPERERKFICM